MIVEWLTRLLTPASREARRLGYLDEAIAIQARYRRVAASWQSHLENSQGVIVQSAATCQQRQRVAVLGSGLLLDIPLHTLLREFGEVHLVDIAHPRSVQKLATQHPAIHLHTHDVTGIAAGLVRIKNAHHAALPEPHATLPPIKGGVDMLISANLLSQLTVVPLAHLYRCGFEDTAPLNAWCREIVADHLAMLRAQAARVCLISDTVQSVVDEEGRILRSRNMVHGMPLGESEKSWNWMLAPRGEMLKTAEIRAHVFAFPDYRSN